MKTRKADRPDIVVTIKGAGFEETYPVYFAEASRPDSGDRLAVMKRALKAVLGSVSNPYNPACPN